MSRLLREIVTDDGACMKLERVWESGALDVQVCAIGRSDEWKPRPVRDPLNGIRTARLNAAERREGRPMWYDA